MQKWKWNNSNSRQEKKQVCIWTDAHLQSEANEQQPNTPITCVINVESKQLEQASIITVKNKNQLIMWHRNAISMRELSNEILE